MIIPAYLSTTRSKYIFILVAVGIVAIIVPVIYRLTVKVETKGAEPPPAQSTIKTKNLNSDNIKVAKDNYGQKIPSYKSTDSNLLSHSSQIQQILDVSDPNPLGISDANLGKGLAYNSEKGSLVIYPNEFSFSSEITNNDTAKNPEDLKAAAVNLIERLNLPGTVATNPKIVLLNTNEVTQTEVSDYQSANEVKLDFVYKLDALTVYNPTKEVSITYDKFGNLKQIVYHPLQTEQGQNVEIIDFKQAKERLKKGNYSLLSVNNQQYSKNAQVLNNVTLEKAHLAYYLPSTGIGDLKPIWVFEGKSQSQKGLNVQYSVSALE